MVKRIVLWVLVISCMALIFSFSAQSAEESTDLSEGFLDKILKFFNINPENEVIVFLRMLIRKVAHFCVYMLLGFLVYLLLQEGHGVEMKISLVQTPVICALYAITDEIHQLFVPGRSGKTADVMLDTAGAVFGMVVAWAICFILSRRKKNG